MMMAMAMCGKGSGGKKCDNLALMSMLNCGGGGNGCMDPMMMMALGGCK